MTCTHLKVTSVLTGRHARLATPQLAYRHARPPARPLCGPPAQQPACWPACWPACPPVHRHTCPSARPLVRTQACLLHPLRMAYPADSACMIASSGPRLTLTAGYAALEIDLETFQQGSRPRCRSHPGLPCVPTTYPADSACMIARSASRLMKCRGPRLPLAAGYAALELTPQRPLDAAVTQTCPLYASWRSDRTRPHRGCCARCSCHPGLPTVFNLPSRQCMHDREQRLKADEVQRPQIALGRWVGRLGD